MSRSRRTAHSRIAALALMALLGTTASCGLGTGAEQFSMPASNTDTHSVAPLSAVGMEALSTDRSMPVYWLSESDGTVRLYREFVQIPGAGDPIAAAVRYMLSSKPRDTDYFNLWRPSTSIGASVSPQNLITIDLGKKAFGASLDRGLAERSIAQLVYTATAAAANAGILSDGIEPSVRIQVDGSSDFLAFGQIPLDQTFTRDATLAAPLWVIDPQAGSSVPAGSVNFRGLSASFSGGEFWEIRRKKATNPLGIKSESTEPVASGQLPAGSESRDTNEFSFSHELGAGEYTFTAWGVDATTDKRIALESKDFTVTE
ncbi:GerMN domain-containing protein [Paeniglutamicibacter sp. NPDC091659]|uniref:GerMN domain-containing protein n=1 Tax=Paeniglutamicibacter sp. NPDC091659 TaxID=3364389 RepID=UPI00381E2D8A